MESNNIGHSKHVGKKFEEYTAKWLKQNGYRILKRNYTAGHKEIDLIAMRFGTIVFVEVKSEKMTTFNVNSETPPIKINQSKMRNIVFCAKMYIRELRKNGISPEEFKYRFDGVGILFDDAYNVTEFKYFKELYKIEESAFL